MKTLKYAARFLIRAKSYTIINLLGLAFSLACCIILMRYIHRELTVDTHCVDRERVITVLTDHGGMQWATHIGYMDTTYLKQEEVLKISEMVILPNTTLVYDNESYAMNVLATDSNFLDLFHYNISEGEARLAAPEDALITRAYAERIFGKESAVGKVLHFNVKTVTIRGVIEQPECKSVFNFDILLNEKLQRQWGKINASLIHVLPGVDLKEINKKSFVYKEYNDSDINFKYRSRYEFVSWEDFYFKNLKSAEDYKDILVFGNLDYLYILCAVAVLLLFVGILNFINLYMVLMMKRSKEYGIKKIFGLQKLPLFVQIWLENFLLAGIALFLSWWLIEVTQVPIGRLLGERMEYTHFDWQVSLGFLVILPLLTSIYPYVRYQYMSPISSMRNLFATHHSVVVRMSFLGVQYIATAILVIFSLYLNNHFQFLMNAPKGYHTERILEAHLLHENLDYSRNETKEEWNKRKAHISRIGQLLDECTWIEKWQNQEGNILEGNQQDMTFFNDKDQSLKIHYQTVSISFFDMYGLKILQGSIPDKIENESMGQYVLALNEAAMKAFGFRNKDEAFIRAESPLGITVMNGKIITHGTDLMPVTAVVNDYYAGHLTNGVHPMVFSIENDSNRGVYYLKVKEGKEKEIIEYLKGIMQDVYNTDDFSYTWMDDEVEALYKEDRKVATIYTIFALIAIAISCLGLFGISLFDIRQRYREIGIRKINGAKIKDLYRLLFRKYVVVLIAAFVVAIPIAYYLITLYTQDFVVKAPIGIGIFIIALLVVSIISLGTLFWQVHKAANINPADVVKSE